ncbi:MAG: hypothetical protein K6G62_05050 [Eubacterium sp.]|nr:hypothetical protein [Eubacterium sp.]
MNISELSPGSKLRLNVAIRDRQFEFESKVAEPSKKEFLIEPIRMDGKLLNVEGNSVTVDLLLIREDEKPIIWKNVDIRCVRHKHKTYYAVDKDLPGKEYNRRREYRLFVGEEMTAHIGSDRTDRSILLKDVSNSGFAFINPSSLEEDEESFVYLAFPAKLGEREIEIPLFGKIVRKMDLPDGRVLYGCVLVKKNEILGRYINQKQMEILAKKRERYGDALE